MIDGEYRVIEDGPPWRSFLNRLLHEKFGAHIILGQPGTGKTSLGVRLAERLSMALGYRIEGVNMYPEDLPETAVTIGMDTLTKRMKQLKQYLDSLATPDEDEKESEGEEGTAGLPPTHRVILIDEAILAMSSSPMDPGRRAALQALAQCRHLSWIVIYIGQWAGQLPVALLSNSVVWVKQPTGREAETDRDHPVVKKLWQDATEGFKSLRGWEWYIQPWKDKRSWAYCDCKSLNGGRGYQGMIPFLPSGKDKSQGLIEVMSDEEETE